MIEAVIEQARGRGSRAWLAAEPVRPAECDRVISAISSFCLLTGPQYRRSRSQTDLAVTARFWAGVFTWRALLRRTRPRAVLIVDDLSAERTALGLAASIERIPIGYVLMPGRRRPAPPFPVDVVFGQSESQGSLGAHGPALFALPELVESVVDLASLEGESLRIGVALNAWGRLDAVLDRCRELNASEFGSKIASIRVRPHPRVASAESEILRNAGCADIVVSDSGESLEVFAESCDLVIAGNTSACDRLIHLGVPVVSIPGLDSLEVDSSYWNAQETPPLRYDNSLSRLSVAEVRNHYESEATRRSSVPKAAGCMTWGDALRSLASHYGR